MGCRVEEQEFESALLGVDKDASISCIICQCANEPKGGMQGRQTALLPLACSTPLNWSIEAACSSLDTMLVHLQTQTFPKSNGKAHNKVYRAS